MNLGTERREGCVFFLAILGIESVLDLFASLSVQCCEYGMSGSTLRKAYLTITTRLTIAGLEMRRSQNVVLYAVI